MTLKQVFRQQLPLLVQSYEREIRVITCAYLAFVRDAEAARWFGSGPRRDPLRRQRAIQQHGESRLHTRDAAPGMPEVARLHVGRRGRVVGRDDVDRSIPHRCPQFFPIRTRTQRRCAFGDGAEPLDILL